MKKKISTDAVDCGQEKEAVYVRTAGAAKMLNVGQRTIRAWMQRGILPYHRLGKKCVLFAVADLNRAIARFRVAAVGE